MRKVTVIRWGLLLFFILAMVGVSFLFWVGDKRQSYDAGHECHQNLKQIESAKVLWALQNKKADTDMPSDKDLFGPGRELESKPKCPEGARMRPEK